MTDTYDLSDTIPDVLDAHPRVTDEADVRTSLPDDVSVKANHMFENALEELLSNAIEYNNTPTPEIEICVDPDLGPAPMVDIRISDNGPGLPASERHPLEKGTENELLHTSGLGLWFVKWTVEHSNGEFCIEDDASGTTVIIRIPKAPEMVVDSVLPTRLTNAS